MKIVSPTKATQILQQLIDTGKSGEVTIGLKPDYRVDATGLASLISLLGLTDKTDLEGGGYHVANPLIYVNIRKVDWDGEVVNWDFPDMGAVTAPEDFRNDSNVALTVNVAAGSTVNLRTKFNTPINEDLQVSWGDSDSILLYNTGTEETPTALTHTYTQAGTYTIFVKGTLIAGTTRNNDTFITALHFIKPVVINATTGIFAMYEKLTDILGTVILKGNTSTITHLFYNNKNITNVKGLKLVFPDTSIYGTKTTSLQHVFGVNCQVNSRETKGDLITDIQLINFDRHAVNNIDCAFYESGLTTIPLKWIGEGVQNGNQAFKNCPYLRYLPAHSLKNLTNGTEMFYCNEDLLGRQKMPLSVSKVTFEKLTKASGMFGNRIMSFNEIKTIFESLPKNPSPKRGFTGNSMIDNIEVGSNYCITFAFDINEPNIKNKLVSYFNLNTQAMMKYHKDYDAVDNGNRTKTHWDGGWYPIYNTYYGHSWDCNNKKGWWVNFRNPYNYHYEP